MLKNIFKIFSRKSNIELFRTVDHPVDSQILLTNRVKRLQSTYSSTGIEYHRENSSFMLYVCFASSLFI